MATMCRVSPSAPQSQSLMPECDQHRDGPAGGTGDECLHPAAADAEQPERQRRDHGRQEQPEDDPQDHLRHRASSTAPGSCVPPARRCRAPHSVKSHSLSTGRRVRRAVGTSAKRRSRRATRGRSVSAASRRYVVHAPSARYQRIVGAPAPAGGLTKDEPPREVEGVLVGAVGGAARLERDDNGSCPAWSESSEKPGPQVTDRDIAVVPPAGQHGDARQVDRRRHGLRHQDHDVPGPGTACRRAADRQIGRGEQAQRGGDQQHGCDQQRDGVEDAARPPPLERDRPAGGARAEPAIRSRPSRRMTVRSCVGLAMPRAAANASAISSGVKNRSARL